VRDIEQNHDPGIAYQRVGVRKHLRKAFLPSKGQSADVFARSLRVDCIKVVD